MPRALLAFLAAATFVAGLATGPAAAQTAPRPAATAKPATAVAAATATATDTLGKIRAAKQINVAFSGDSLPFSFVDDKGQPAGFSIDLCKRVIVQIGRAAGVPDLKTHRLVGTVAERIAMVASGKADLDCANTSATLSRMADVDFSALIFVDGGGFLVRSDSSAKRFAELAGKNIGVLSGTTTEKRLDEALKTRLVNAKVTKLNDGNEGIAMLESGSLDAFASDKIKLVGLAAQAKDPNALAMLPDDLSIEPYAFAMPRNDSAFRLQVNRALTQVYNSPELENIFTRWLGKIGRPSGLLAAMYLLNTWPE
ncbi:MAG: amino acid ABC transporter substrate-binding protein [Betaproteobacteria bacterium]